MARPWAAAQAPASVGDYGAPTDATIQPLAGGTTLLDLMKPDIMRPQAPVGINPLGAD